MKIVLDIEIPNFEHKKEYIIPNEVKPLILHLKKLIADRLKIIAEEINSQPYGMVVHISSLNKIYAVGFSDELKIKIEDSFTDEDMQYLKGLL